MKFIDRNFGNIAVALAALIIGISGSAAFGQNSAKEGSGRRVHSFCDNNNYWSDGKHSSFREVRELTAPASGKVSVDGQRNGGISVIGEDRSEIAIKACVQAWSDSDDAAKMIASSIKINTSGTIRAESSADDDWSVSYEIRVPRSSNLELVAHNGGISVRSVEGSINFETMNGGVNLDGVAGSVKGRTTNGGINVSLTGSSWKGTGLDVQTTNGGVNINVPENFAAHVEAGTVNGGFTSNIVGLQVSKGTDDDGYYHPRPKTVNTDINGGGPLVRVITTNGGVRINTLVQ